MTDIGGEAQMEDSKSIWEGAETEKVAAGEAQVPKETETEKEAAGETQAPMETETEKVDAGETQSLMETKTEDVEVKDQAQVEEAEIKNQVQVEEPNKPEEDKVQSQQVDDKPDLVEKQADANQKHEDTSNGIVAAAADGQNKEILNSAENDEVELKGVEDKLLTKTVTKMEVVEGADAATIHSHDNGVSGSPSSDIKPQDDDYGVENGERLKDLSIEREYKKQLAVPEHVDRTPILCFDNSGSDTEEEQAAFVKEVEAFHKEKNIEFKHPKFYKEDLNLLKLWRAVIKLGGYEQVTSCKLWRQVGESFNPPKTCTTVSWTFRIFYEKALLEYEKHKIHGGELTHPIASFAEPSGVESQAVSQTPGSGRAKRDAAARAMRSWHSQRVLDNGEVCHPIIKDKSSSPAGKNDRQLKNYGLLKRKKASSMELGLRNAPFKAAKAQLRLDTMVIDIGPPADWVKINVHKTNDCYELYALVPGLLREEVHVQSDPAGRLVISGEPKELDNPWGVTSFKKVVSLPSRIDPQQTAAVVTLHGQLFVRVPLEMPDV